MSGQRSRTTLEGYELSESQRLLGSALTGGGFPAGGFPSSPSGRRLSRCC